MIELKPFVRSRDLEVFSPAVKKGAGEIMLDSLSRFFAWAGGALGITFGAEVPEELLGYDVESWPALVKIRQMQKMGIADFFSTDIWRRADEPRAFVSIIGLTGENQVLGSSGLGYDFFDKGKTLWPAMGEAVERWALRQDPREYGARAVRAPYTDVKGKALDIFSFAGYSPELRQKGHPIYNLTFDEQTPFTWMEGRALTDGSKMLVPLQLITFSHNYDKELRDKKEPVILKIVSTGAAVAPNRMEAIFRGLAETIERDAFMIHWLNKLTPDIIDIASLPDERFGKLLRRFERYNLEVYPLYLRTDAPIHIVLSVIIDRTGVGPAVTVGAKASFDLHEAAYHAINENFASRLGIYNLRERHLASGGIDFPDIKKIGHEERLVYWCDKKRLPDIDFLLSGDKKPYGEFPKYRRHDTAGGLEILRAFLRDNGYEGAWREILEPALAKKLGMTAVMVVVPALQPLHLLESLPCFYGRRLREVPEKLGLRPAEEINTVPHPFP